MANNDSNGVSWATLRWLLGIMGLLLLGSVGFATQIGWDQVQRNTEAIEAFRDNQIIIETKLDALLRQ